MDVCCIIMMLWDSSQTTVLFTVPVTSTTRRAYRVSTGPKS